MQESHENGLKKQVLLFNAFYLLMLIFLFFPLVFPGSTFRGYGKMGYGLRQQISTFAKLAKPEMSIVLLLLINSLVILLIIAIIFSVCFSIISMIIINKTFQNDKPLNFKLLRVFNLCTFASLSFVFITTFPGLTFSFVCCYLLAFFALLLNLKPEFATDLFARKGNEAQNSSSIMIILSAILFACCFSPIYLLHSGGWISYNFFNFVMSLFKGDSLTIDSFLVVMSVILMVIILLMFAFSVLKYLIVKGKARLNYINIAVLIVSVILILLIGSFIKIENQRATNPPQLGTIYYAFLSLAIASTIIPFIQKAVDLRTTKK